MKLEASAASEAYIGQYNLGGGNWTGGQLCERGQPVGRVSYNGRVWDVHERCVYDPVYCLTPGARRRRANV